MLGKASIKADGGGNAGPSALGRYNAMKVPRCWMRSAAIELTRFGIGASTGLEPDAGVRATAMESGLPELVVLVGL